MSRPRAGYDPASPPYYPIQFGHPMTGQPQSYYVDQRYGWYISWMMEEFRAANGIIDSLMHHLWAIGDHEEYVAVLRSINQRRQGWGSALMQPTSSISSVVHELMLATSRRQQQQERRGNRSMESTSPDSWEIENEAGSRDEDPMGRDVDRAGEAEQGEVSEAVADPTLKNAEVAEENGHDNRNSKSDRNKECSSGEERNHEMEQSSTSRIPKTFVAEELEDGRTVNAVDGLQLYDDLLDYGEVRELLSLATNLREAGNRGQFQDQTYITSERPIKGHGKRLIQLGIPVVDSPAGLESLDKKVEPIPALLQDIADRLVRMQITPVKPDSCTIDFYREGEFSWHRTWPRWYGRPVCVLFLTECSVVFGKTFFPDSHQEYFRGTLCLPLLPGSLLVMQGPAADSTRHSITPFRKQRIIVTFTKCQPKPVDPGTTSSPPAPPLHQQTSAPVATPAAPTGCPAAPPQRLSGPRRPSIEPRRCDMASPNVPTECPAAPPRHSPPSHLASPSTGDFPPLEASPRRSGPRRGLIEPTRCTSASPNVPTRSPAASPWRSPPSHLSYLSTGAFPPPEVSPRRSGPRRGMIEPRRCTSASPNVPTGSPAAPPWRSSPSHLSAPSTGVLPPPEVPRRLSGPRRPFFEPRRCISASPSATPTFPRRAEWKPRGHNDLKKSEEDDDEGDHTTGAVKQHGTA